MAGASRERFLLLVVILSILFFGGSYAYQSFGDSVWLQQSDIEERLEAINTMLENQRESGAVIKRYEEMTTELAVEGEDSEQLLTIREQISMILEQANLKGKYRSITPKDPDKADDFKIISFSIENIECTPRQLGELLYLIEKQSAVMEVTKCDMDNQIRDNGEMGYGILSGEDNPQDLLGGFLSVDLEISRLVEYRNGEKPKKKR